MISIEKVEWISAITALLVASFIAFGKEIITKIPKALIQLFINSITTKMIISDPNLITAVSVWARSNKSYKRQLYAIGDKGEGLAIDKSYWFWWYGIAKIRLFNHNSKNDPDDRVTIMDVVLFPKSDRKLDHFLKLIKSNLKNTDTLNIYSYQHEWSHSGNSKKRPLYTLYMDKSTKNDIMQDAKHFIDNQDWYNLRGIPYRRGHLYFGPPGCGKSTAIKVLASELDLPLYTINLSNMDDDDLQYALGRTSVPCVLAIEDVDSFEFSHARKNVKGEADTKGLKIKQRRHRIIRKATTCEVTLAGLLNAIDGIASKEGTILVLTSNDPGVLDPALIRSGRVDKRYEFKNLESEQVLEMFKVFFKDKEKLHKKVLDFSKNKSHSASWWQGYFLDNNDDIEKAFK